MQQGRGGSEVKPLSGGRQADFPFSVDVDIGRGLTPKPAPPGTAATPSEPGKHADVRSRGRSPVRHTLPKSRTPAASRSPWPK
ncbi:hypothetical protein [Pectobacterium polaris]|uniref:hypothetical protein n=1 Tax=Pectobacterium polaris TaxID=2042057 RepID=UPI0015825393|nr:hypothetical protein [Pectobacterium polaris]MCA6956267.1 hypothetical protein [Pectobacterium polaris]